MKRIRFACIEKTLHFQLKEELDHITAVNEVKREAEHYKETLVRKDIKHKIIEERTEPDDSIMIKIKMQYNSIPLGDYLN